MSARLKGVSIVVTRPAHQAEPLCRRLDEEGAEVVRFPVMEIAEPRDKNTLFAIIDTLADFDLAIFISPNAVNRAISLINSRVEFPPHLLIAAVGQGSARALEKSGRPVDIFPVQSFNSEALLALPELSRVEHKKVVIFRGEGGRELLADTLRQRGAVVVYAECYRRIIPQFEIAPLLSHWERGEAHVIIVTSNDGLQNLYDMIPSPDRCHLLKTPLVVISQRMCALSAKLGFIHAPIVAESASDEALVNAVITWRSDQLRSTIS